MKPQEIPQAPADAVIALDAGEAVRDTTYGRRAAKLARLTALGLPVPPGVALSFDCVRALADGGPMPDLALPRGRLLALRGSPEHRAWGGPHALLNLGIGPETLPGLARTHRRPRHPRAATPRHPGLRPRGARPRPGGLRGARPQETER